MCGFLGIYGPDANEFSNKIWQNSKLLEHRGPDETSSLYLNDLVGVHNRLSILDPENGKQPMYSSDGRYILFYNGELYNNFEIRSKLANVSFKTRSDTETLFEILRNELYEIFRFIDGMWSFIFIDRNKNKIIYGRDKFGQKPLYISTQNNKLFFSSEEKGLLEILGNQKVDANQIWYFLKHRHTIGSLFENIENVEQGKIFSWSFELNHRETLLNLSESKVLFNEKSKNLEEALSHGVSNCLISDVEMGVLLSGGVDSSLISLVAKKSIHELQYYFLKTGHNIDDYNAAMSFSNRNNLNLRVIKFPSDQVSKILFDFYKKNSSLIGDSSTVLMLYLFSKIKEMVKVILTGDGADELFLGYDNFYPFLASRGIDLNYYKFLYYISNKLNFPKFLNHQIFYEMINLRSVIKSKKPGIILKDEFSYKCKEKMEFHYDHEISLLQNVVNYDREQFLPNNILLKSDRTSMQHSIEVRSPYLSHNLIPFAWKDSDSTSKYEFKANLKQLLLKLDPEFDVNRQKFGFGAPVNAWIGTEDEKNSLMQLFIDPKSKVYSHFIEFDKAQKFKKNIHLVWNVINMEIWLRCNEKYIR